MDILLNAFESVKHFINLNESFKTTVTLTHKYYGLCTKPYEKLSNM